MKTRVVVALLVVGIAAWCEAQEISSLLADRRYVTKQINCILEQGQCDGIGKQIKVILPEALNNNCRRCTPLQKKNARKLLEFMEKRHPNDWHLIAERYGVSRKANQ